MSLLSRVQRWVCVSALGGGTIILAGLTSPPLIVRAAEPIERFTAVAVNMTGVGRAGAGTLDIAIERWSTDGERDRLLSTLLEKGPDALYRRLQQAPRIGYIRTPQSIGWALHYARSIDRPDHSRQIVIATDRPLGFWEARNQPRSIDYKFTLIDIRFDADGKGVGKLGYATKISVNKETNTIELENFGIEPVRLTDVRSSQVKPS